MERRSIVVIPARGGSKRFPRKNVAPLLGRPLLAYTVAAGRRASTVASTVVSTDDAEIAQIAADWGAEIPCLRPADLATDHVTADHAVAHMIHYLRDNKGLEMEVVVLIQPTSPFVLPSHIDQAVEMLLDNPDLDSVTTLARLDHRLHPYNLCQFREGASWDFILPEQRAAAKTRQSKPAAYQFANLFAARSRTMLETGRFGDRKGGIVVDDVFAWDVDHPWQLRVAEFMLREGIVDLGELPVSMKDHSAAS